MLKHRFSRCSTEGKNSSTLFEKPAKRFVLKDMVNSPTFPEDFIVLPLGQRVFGLVTYVMIIMVSFDVLGIKQIQRNGCPVMASGFAVLIRLMSRHDMSRSTGVHVSDKFSILFSVKLFVKFQHWTAQKKNVFKLRVICRWIELSNCQKSSHLFAKLIHDIFSTSWWKISPSFQAFP